MDSQNRIRTAIDSLRTGNLQEAERIFREILEWDPYNVSALHFIGIIHYQRKDYESSIQYIRKALQFGPNYADAYNNLGIVLQEMGQIDEAITSYRNAIRLNPYLVRAYYNIGTAYKDKWQIDEAIVNYQKAIQFEPDFAEAYNKLGNALQDQGKLAEAEDCYRKAIKLKPYCSPYYDNLLFMLNYDYNRNAEAIFSEHLEFAKHFEEPLAFSIAPHINKRSLDRTLRIGYVSPDFVTHSVSYFIEPVLASHSHDKFEIFCYSDVDRPDAVTERLQKYSDQWRNITGIDDERVAEIIRKDRIDILIDLAGHTGGNRMLLFARKPAPVQVSWIGYPATTGLSAMDYKIVDSYTDPPGMTEQYYSEKLLRLHDSFLCYLPCGNSPDVQDLPAVKAGCVTFGSFNYFPKVSEEAAALWSVILNALPASRLILKARNFADERTRKYALEMFTRHGLSSDRIELMSATLSFTEHLDIYNRIDIALDTFPYNGTATTCEALWMGVPVITLAGGAHAARVGLSILSNIGLSELIAYTPDEYLSIATSLAYDINKLRSLRIGLRSLVVQSTLTNALYFTDYLEHFYQDIWRAWCNSH